MNRLGCLGFGMALLLLAAFAVAQKAQLLPVVVNEKYGFIDTSGNMVLQPHYERVFDFGEKKYAVVFDQGKYGVIDLYGHEIFPCSEDSIKILFDSIFAIKHAAKWFLRNIHGPIADHQGYTSVTISGNAWIKFRSGEYYGVLDNKGTLVVPAEYDDFTITDSLIYTRLNGYIGLFATNGTKYLDADNDEVIRKNKGLAFFEKGGKMGYVALQTGRVVPALWDEVILLQTREWRNTKAITYAVIVVRDEKQGLFLSLNDSLILPPEYQAIQENRRGFISFQQEGKMGLLSTVSGKILIQPAYNEIEFMGGNYFRIEENKKSGVADSLGQLLIRPIYPEIVFQQYDSQNRGLFTYSKNGRIGLIRSDSTQLTETVFFSIQSVGSEFLVAKNNGKCALMGLDGVLLTGYDFDRIEMSADGIHTVYSQQLVGLVNHAGKILLRPVYEKITAVDKTFKAYKGDILEILWLDDNNEVYDKVIYEGVPSVHLNDANVRIYQWTTPPPPTATSINREYRFFYSTDKRKWGIKEYPGGKVAVEPQFDRVLPISESRYAYVFNNSDTIPYSIDDCNFYALQLCGLVDMTMGRVLLMPFYLDIRLSNAGYSSWIATVINKDGKLGYANESGIFLENYTFICPFKSRVARINIGGALMVTKTEDENTVANLGHYINSFKCRLRYADGNTRNTVLDEDSRLSCMGGHWGQLIASFGRAELERYDWISKEYAGIYIVRNQNRSSLLSDRSFVSITNMNYNRYLTGQGRYSLFVISKEKPKYGFISNHGKLLTDVCYDFAYDYSEGFAAVKDSGRWGFLDQYGAMAIPAVYPAVRSFSEEMAAIKTGTKWGYINTRGDTVIPSQFNKAGDFKEGLATVRKTGKGFYINTQGEKAFNEEFLRCQEYSNGVAIASTQEGTGVINSMGSWLVPSKFDKILFVDRDQGIAIVKKKNKVGVYALGGDKLIPIKFDAILPPSEGLMAVRRGGMWGYFTIDGKQSISFKYTGAKRFSCNRAIVRTGAYWGIIDAQNKVIKAFEYSNIESYSEGICFATKARDSLFMLDSDGLVLKKFVKQSMLHGFDNNKAAIKAKYKTVVYLDNEGNKLFTREFSAGHAFEGTRARVRMGEEWGLIDEQGQWIVTPTYDSIRAFSEDKAVVVITNQEGIADSKGRIYLQPEYHSIEMAPYNLIRVRKNGAMGYVTLGGKVIWKPTK